MGFGSRLLASEIEGGELLFAALFIPQIAACVRFWTRILRRIALTWTFTVASAMSIFFAMHLLVLPSIRQRRIDFSRGESCGAMSSVVTRISSPFSSLRAASSRWLPSDSRMNDRNAAARVPVPEKLNLFERRVKIIAGMNDEKQRLGLSGFVRG